MWQHLKNIYYLGVKELIELGRDHLMLILIVYAFTLGVFVTGMGTPDSVKNGTIAVVDGDRSQLSQRVTDAFLPPLFRKAVLIEQKDIDPEMDRDRYTFILVIPSRFERDVLSGNHPEIQLNVDATCMSQAFVGAGYIQQIVQQEIKRFLNREQTSLGDAAGTTAEAADSNNSSDTPVRLVMRDRYNANLTASWFGGVNQLINMITMLAIILIGTALIRERERGTLEHLLVMPVIPFEIMCAKIWSMLVVVLIATCFSVGVVLRYWLGMPIDGSVVLYAVGVALHLFSVTSFGIFLACIVQNMPQMGILILLVLMPMQMLSGGVTPQESMPVWVQKIMLFAPTTHFVKFSQQILFRGAGLNVVWEPFLAIALIGMVLFLFSLRRFRKMAA